MFVPIGENLSFTATDGSAGIVLVKEKSFFGRVTETPAGRILKYHGQTGAFLSTFGQDPALFGPTDLEFRGDDLFVGMWSNGFGRPGGVARINAQTGALETTFGVENFRRRTSLNSTAATICSPAVSTAV